MSEGRFWRQQSRIAGSRISTNYSLVSSGDNTERTESTLPTEAPTPSVTMQEDSTNSPMMVTAPVPLSSSSEETTLHKRQRTQKWPVTQRLIARATEAVCPHESQGKCLLWFGMQIAMSPDRSARDLYCPRCANGDEVLMALEASKFMTDYATQSLSP